MSGVMRGSVPSSKKARLTAMSGISMDDLEWGPMGSTHISRPIERRANTLSKVVQIKASNGTLVTDRKFNFMVNYVHSGEWAKDRAKRVAAAGPGVNTFLEGYGGYVNNGGYKKGDNPFLDNFGATATPYKMNEERMITRDMRTLPDAYVGQSLRVAQQVDFLLALGTDNWYSVILPVRETDQLKIDWVEYTFDQELPDDVPELGTARYIEDRSEARSARTRRYGLALTLEHGFMDTPEGVRRYNMGLQQIAAAMLLGMKFSVIYALLTARDYNKEYEAKLGIKKYGTIKRVLQADRDTFATIQKDEKPMEKLDTNITMEMERYGGATDTWIMTPGAVAYLSLVRPEKRYYYSGQRTPGVELADSKRPVGTIVGKAVYKTRTFNVSHDMRYDIMTRKCCIGGYNMMVDRNPTADPKKYKSVHRNIRVYDDEKDDMVTITLKMALDNCYLFDSTGKLANPVSKFSIPQSAGQMAADPWRMMKPNPGLVNIKYFGQMDPKHFSVESMIRLAMTAVNTVSNSYKEGYSAMAEIYRKGLAEIKTIESEPGSPQVAEFFQRVIDSARVGGSTIEANTNWYSGRARQSRRMTEIKRNKFGSHILPNVTGTGTRGAASTNIPVGYANWPGLQTIADHYSREGTNPANPSLTRKGYSAEMFENIRDWVRLISAMTTALNSLFPGSMFLDEARTSPWFKKASSECVLVENLCLHARVPIFFSRDVTGGTGPASTKMIRLRTAFLTKAATAAPTGTAIRNSLEGVFQAVAGPVTQAQFEANNKNFPLAIYPIGSVVTHIQEAITDCVLQGLMLLLENISNVGEQRAMLQSFLDEIGLKYTNPGTRTKSSFTPKVFIKWFTSYAKKIPDFKEVYADAIAKFKTILKQAQLLKPSEYTIEQDATLAGDQPGASGSYRMALTSSPALFQYIYTNGSGAFEDPSAKNLKMRPASLKNQDFAMDISEAKSVVGILATGKAKDLPIHFKSLENDALIGRKFEHVSAVVGFTSDGKIDTSALSSAATETAKVSSSIYGDLEEELMSGVSVIGSKMSVDSGVVDARTTRMDVTVGETFKANFANVASKTRHSPILRIISQVYLGTEVHKNVYEGFINNNILCPIGFVHTRPNHTVGTDYGIAVLAGSATGNTFVGHRDWQTGDDVMQKRHVGVYNMRFAAVVTNRKNVWVVDNIFVRQYYGGFNTKPFTPSTYNGKSREISEKHSSFFFALGFETRELPNPFDISGQWWQHIDSVVDKSNYNVQHYETAARYNAFWGFFAARTRPGVVESMNPQQLAEYTPHNTVVWRNLTHFYNPKSGLYDDVEENTGHFGHITGPGTHSMREGKKEYHPKGARIHLGM